MTKRLSREEQERLRKYAEGTVQTSIPVLEQYETDAKMWDPHDSEAARLLKKSYQALSDHFEGKLRTSS